MKILKVSDRFPCPGPRYETIGPSSGEEFKKLLSKSLKGGDPLLIDLDGTLGYGSSFLEESFGGLVREGLEPSLIRKITFISEEEPELIEEIKKYIEDAIDLLTDD